MWFGGLRLSVVSDDLGYGGCNWYLTEANAKRKRADGVRSVEHFEVLKPNIVVPGHERAGRLDGVYLTKSTRN